MGDGIAPFPLGSMLLCAVVDDGGGEGAGDCEEDEPVARRELKAESGQAWQLIIRIFPRHSSGTFAHQGRRDCHQVLMV